jgi:hypothetical protein
MVARTFIARTPARWVTATEEFAADQRLRTFLERNQVWFVLGWSPDRVLPFTGDGRAPQHTAATAASLLPEQAWVPGRELDGVSGSPHLWARLPTPPPGPGRLAHWLLLRRGPAGNGDLRSYLCGSSPTTSLAELARVASLAEDNVAVLASACENTGLDQYEVRHWTSWYRYTTLSLAAHNCVALAGDPRDWTPPAPPEPVRPEDPPRPRRAPGPARPGNPSAKTKEEQPCPQPRQPAPRRPSTPCRPCATRSALTSNSGESTVPPRPKSYHWPVCRNASVAESGH